MVAGWQTGEKHAPQNCFGGDFQAPCKIRRVTRCFEQGQVVDAMKDVFPLNQVIHHLNGSLLGIPGIFYFVVSIL